MRQRRRGVGCPSPRSSATCRPSKRPRRSTGASWYVDDTEHVAESPEQGEIIRDLHSRLTELARQRGWTRVYVGADNYFAWMPEHPQVRVSPNLFLLNDPPSPWPRSWQTWRPGQRPPHWALEVVSEDWAKDYQDGPAKYALLGCAELVLFDPDAVRGVTKSQSRVPLTVFRRGEDGALARVYSGPGPAYSAQLGCWLRARRDGYAVQLRLSEDEAGVRLVLNRAEAAEAARAEAERRLRELEEELRQSRHKGP
ncbi:MAG: Uma2 family endonuclease [Myxococcales bacterium]